ncbi:MAG: 4Fe-4S binding protein [Bacteroidales bacterium]|nr:4Fe-4S binding protein [Bacteroidales bacterium]RLD37408.1 MAG: (4Fe-4S)-binding protein [Bacteroidota bacterium]
MKQITIVSGKGGTGKTSITSAFASIAQNKILVDCDVDAADLFLTTQPTIIEQHEYEGGKIAVIDAEACTNCGICEELCRFDAISLVDGQTTISEFSCDGCKLCEIACPVNAITMEENMDSSWFKSDTRFGPMVHAKLGIGEDNSGKLVTKIRDIAVQIAKEKEIETVLIDGPPGIGCPVISTLTGVDVALMVTEPTLSGMHDLHRLIELAKGFKLKSYVMINKFDLNTNISNDIEKLCQEEELEVLAKIPFNRDFVDAMVNQQTVVEYAPESDLSKTLTKVWNRLETS